MSIKVERVTKRVLVAKDTYEEVFDHFRATIGDKVFDPIPIGFLRVSELPKLQEMLEEAWKQGHQEGFLEESGQL